MIAEATYFHKVRGLCTNVPPNTKSQKTSYSKLRTVVRRYVRKRFLWGVLMYSIPHSLRREDEEAHWKPGLKVLWWASPATTGQLLIGRNHSGHGPIFDCPVF